MRPVPLFADRMEFQAGKPIRISLPTSGGRGSVIESRMSDGSPRGGADRGHSR